MKTKKRQAFQQYVPLYILDLPYLTLFWQYVREGSEYSWWTKGTYLIPTDSSIYLIWSRFLHMWTRQWFSEVGVKVLFSHTDAQFFQHHLSKRFPFSYWIALAFLSEITWSVYVGLFLDSPSYVIDLSMPLPLPLWLDYSSFISN